MSRVPSRAPTWWLYLIECEDGSIYCGIAVNVAERYARHSAGKGAAYTRSRKPRRLLAQWAYPSRSAALKAEIRVKRLAAREKRLLIERLYGGLVP